MRLLVTLLAAALAAAAPLRVERDPDAIAELDRLIQLRFLDGKDFGMRRVIPFEYHGLRTFAAENAAELAAVDRLKSGGYEVALYLAGRGVLAAAPGLTLRRDGVQGPAYITTTGEGLPAPASLLEESRRALALFRERGGYSVEKDGWTVALRPLRAAHDACIQCHVHNGAAGLKSGDPLGVALYVYRRR